MRISGKQTGLTLLEVLVVIGVIVLFLSIFVPAAIGPGGGLRTVSRESKTLGDAKTIGFACKAYGTDHDGQYPSYAVLNGTISKTRISDYSNTAFEQLLPAYLQTIQPFYLQKSAWTPNPDISSYIGFAVS
jgi:competence protein ComGC